MPGVLDVILDLQKKGLSDAEIISQLRNMNFSAQEISDAINQVKIKSAVNEKEEMQPSILQTETAEEEVPVPTPSKKKKIKFAKEQYPQYPQAPAYTYTAYEQPQPAPAAEVDIETIEEITEEIVSEKFSEIRDKISGILDFKESVESKINNLNERMKRIESTIDGLQTALLTRVQEYSQDIKNLGSEMHALEGAFGKVLNPLIDNVKELGSVTEKLKSKQKGK
jgi:chromosome segregation ATPase